MRRAAAEVFAENATTGGVVADYFLKVDGIAGESTDRKHKDEIELASFSWGLTRSEGGGGGGGAGAARAEFQSFNFITRVNKASPQLFLAAASGKHIKEAYLTARKAGKGQLEYLKIKFTDVLITSFQETGGAEAPDEMIGFNFGKIALEYTAQSPRGAAADVFKAGWDLSKNVKI
jgi:type VI secretion system secreted protein Hcp